MRCAWRIDRANRASPRRGRKSNHKRRDIGRKIRLRPGLWLNLRNGNPTIHFGRA
jgi:hypothetical protein